MKNKFETAEKILDPWNQKIFKYFSVPGLIL